MFAAWRRMTLALTFLVLTGLVTTQAQQRARPVAVVTPMAEATGVRAGSEIRLALRVTLPDTKLHVQSNKPREEGLIPTVLTLDAGAGVTVAEVVYPVATEFAVAGFDDPLLVYGSEFLIGARLLVPEGATGDLAVQGRLRYQACDDLVCYLPITVETRWVVPIVSRDATVSPQYESVFKTIRFGSGEKPPTVEAPATATSAAAAAPVTSADGLAMMDRFALRASAGGYMDSEAFVTFLSNAEAGIQETSWFEGRGPLAIIALVLVGGLALNLTPCVLPMIPINLAIIGAGARAGSRQRGFILGASYGLAMTLVYGALGLIVILTSSAFGAINASPWFNLAIAVVFVVLGLAMFDLLVIDFSRWSSAFRPRPDQQGSVGLAFTMGGIAALLAGACVAPVVIQVVLFASDMYAGGTAAALALPFVLGLGMAIPWPLAGAGMASLPKPGAWMVRVKYAFGVIILATAAYYGYLAYSLFADRWVDSAAVNASVEDMLKDGWYPSLADGLVAAEREGKPVLLDLWATWCKNCLVMDQTTLKDPAVVSALDQYVKVKVQAEHFDDPSTSALMERIDAVGLPAYAVLHPQKPLQ